jgi:4-amino-4-deoxy-L-arabinose transferase-like glycosyltransferase
MQLLRGDTSDLRILILLKDKIGSKKNTLFRIYFLLGSLEGIASLYFLLRSPSDAENARLLGYSVARLALAVGVGLPVLLLAWLAFKSMRSRSWLTGLSNQLETRLNAGRRDATFLMLSGLGALLSMFLLVAAPLTGHAILLRLVPVTVWFTALGWQTCLALFLLSAWSRSKEQDPERYRRQARVFWLLVIFSAGLVLRLAALGLVDVPLEETRRQDIAAGYVKTGEWTFCNHYFPFCGPGNNATASVEPVPVLIYVVFMKFFGIQNVFPIIAFQMSLGLASAWIVYRIIMALFGDDRRALLGAFLWITYAPLTATSELSLEAEPFFTFFLALGVLFTLYGLEKWRARDWLVAGIGFGAAALSRSSMLYFLPLLVGISLFLPTAPLRLRLRNTGLLALMLVLIFSPWVIRNYRVFNAFVPGVTLSGYNLYRHNHILADGDPPHYVYSTELKETQADLLATRTDLRGDENEAEMDRVYQEEALRIIRAHPVRYLELSLYRFIPLWTNLGVRYGLIPDAFWNLAAVENLILLALALPAVFRRRAIHPRALLLILGLVGFYNVIYVMVNARMRFLVPVMPFVIALAADQLIFSADRFRLKSNPRGATAGDLN